MTDGLDRWVDEEGSLEEAGGSALGALLVSAGRAQAAICEDGAAGLLDSIRMEARERRRQLWGAHGARALAVIAASVAVLALLSPPPPPRGQAAVAIERVVVKHLSVESIQDGRVRSLQMTLHRTQKKEKSHVSIPLL